MVLNEVSDWEEIPKELLSLFRSSSNDPDMVWGIYAQMKKKKNNDKALTRMMPHLYQSFSVRDYAVHEDLGEGICGHLWRSMLL